VARPGGTRPISLNVVGVSKQTYGFIFQTTAHANLIL
jgi:hypothetical protein